MVALGAVAAFLSGGPAGAAPPPPFFDNLTLRNSSGAPVSGVTVAFHRSEAPGYSTIEAEPFRTVEFAEIPDGETVFATAGDHGVSKIVVTATAGGVTKSCMVTSNQVSAWNPNPPYEYSGICNQAPKQVDGCLVNNSNFPATFEIRAADAAHPYAWCRLMAKCRWGCYWGSVPMCMEVFEPPHPPEPEREPEKSPEQKSAK